jgi:hypothetical protein
LQATYCQLLPATFFSNDRQYLFMNTSDFVFARFDFIFDTLKCSLFAPEITNIPPKISAQNLKHNLHNTFL